MMKQSLIKLAVAGALLAASSAQADIITFDGLAGTAMPGADSYLATLQTYFDANASVVDGYTFQTQLHAGHWYTGYWNTVVFCGGVQVNCAYNGTDFLSISPFLTVKRADGQAFSLNGIDLDNEHDAAGDSAVGVFKLTGMYATGGSVSTTVTLDDLPNSVNFGTSAAFNHFDFTGFTNLASFNIERVGDLGWNYIAIDNLNVSLDAGNAVPEPASVALFGLGLLGLAACRKRRAR